MAVTERIGPRDAEGLAVDVRQSSMGQARLSEREIAAARESALAFMRATFRDMDDSERESYAQEAALELVAKLRAGEAITHPRALAKKIARRRAIDDLRSPRADQLGLTDPDREAAHGADPAEVLANRERLSRGVAVLCTFPEADRRLYREQCVEGIKPGKVARRLGLLPRTARKRLAPMARALASIEASDELSQRELKLLSAYALGAASLTEARAARRLAASSPAAAAALCELRQRHRDVGALLPPLVLAPATGSSLDRIAALPGTVRDTAYGLLRPEAAQAVNGPLSTGLGASGGQLAALCGGAATVACVAVIAPGAGQRAIDQKPAKAAIEREVRKTRPAATQVAPVLPSQVGNETPAPVTASPAPSSAVPSSDSGEDAEAESDAPATSEPVPAEQSSESDFAFGAQSASASAAAATDTAATESGGGGGGSGEGGASSAGGDFAFGE